MSAFEWRPDILVGYSAAVLPLAAFPEEGEPSESLCATLVRRDGQRCRHAVLYVHGWSDYFFHTHVADYFESKGFSFYALDLRRYGRSLLDGQLAGYISDLDDYSIEFELATDYILGHHDDVIVMAHSTGGLSVSLWADQNPGVLSGLILNSPWLEMQGSWVVRSLAVPLVAPWGQTVPTASIPLPERRLYAKSLHVKYGGEWNYDLRLKPEVSAPVRAGWIAAVLKGHERVAAGLRIDCPIAVFCSARSDFRVRWDPAMRTADSVLDVQQIALRSIKLGDVVTTVRILDGMHDLTLSLPPARARLFAELDRWLRAYSPAEHS